MYGNRSEGWIIDMAARRNSMRKSTKKIKQVCECKHCGNEAEMVVTCTIDDTEGSTAASQAHEHKEAPVKVKGTATCTSCGNEADMWVDL
jgi:transcription elongation factor Elf1